MRRVAVIAFLATVVATLAGLLTTALADDRPIAFTLGVSPGFTALELQPGAEGCQAPIVVPEEFSAVKLSVRAGRREGPPLAVMIRERMDERVLGSAAVPPGYRGDVDVDASFAAPIPAERTIALCVRNAGDRPVGLHGGPRQAVPTSMAFLDGRPRRTDIAAVFVREEPSTALSLVPEMFERASLFHPAWVGEWTFWLLTALVLFAAPALTLRALLAAAANREGGREDAG